MKRRFLFFAVRWCPVCERPLPPEGASCPYCNEPLPLSWMSRLWITCCGSALALGIVTVAISETLPILTLPATLAYGLLLAGGTAVLLAPFHWQGVRPSTRHERMAAIRHCLGQRVFTTLATVSLLFVLRRAPHTRFLVVASVALLLTAAMAVVTSRDTRAGLLAGVLIGLA